MKSLAERLDHIWQGCEAIWKSIQEGPAEMPSRVAIPSGHVHNKKEKLGTSFQPNAHYFQVRVNEMYLTYRRKWWTEYDPMVFTVTEFTYDKKPEAVPFLVGPMMMEKFSTKTQKIPTGMVFSDTRVAGLHPYQGGRLSLSVVLCRIKREDYAQKLFQIVESAATVLDFSTALSTYVKVASVVSDGIEALLGLEDSKPLIGFRKEYDPDAGDPLEPSYFALIDQPNLGPDELWVQGNQLLRGKSLAQAKAFRDADYVLYSISQTSDRSDIRTLPFYPLWERVLQEAAVPKKENWESAKANLSSLFQTLILSPDLTRDQARLLAKTFREEMKQAHDEAVDMATLGPGKAAAPSELDQIRKESLRILKM